MLSSIWLVGSILGRSALSSKLLSRVIVHSAVLGFLNVSNLYVVQSFIQQVTC